MRATRRLRISAANIGPNRFHQNRTDVDPALGQQILDVAQRQWVSHVHHHDQTDDLWRAVEISKRITHAPRLTQPGQPRICPDTAHRSAARPIAGRIASESDRAEPASKIDDNTFVMADVERKAITQVKEAAQELLSHRLSPARRKSSLKSFRPGRGRTTTRSLLRRRRNSVCRSAPICPMKFEQRSRTSGRRCTTGFFERRKV